MSYYSNQIIQKQYIPSNQTVGGSAILLPAVDNPPFIMNPYNFPTSDAQPTLVNTNVSASVAWNEPYSSQTPATFMGQQPNLKGVQSTIISNYGDVYKVVPASAVTPTSYNYTAPIRATVWTPEAYPQPQYLLDRPVLGNVITSGAY